VGNMKEPERPTHKCSDLIYFGQALIFIVVVLVLVWFMFAVACAVFPSSCYL